MGKLPYMVLQLVAYTPDVKLMQNCPTNLNKIYLIFLILWSQNAGVY